MKKPLTNSQFFRLDWIARNEGCPIEDTKGKIFDWLLVTGLLEVREGRVFLTPAGRAAAEEG